MTDDSEGLRAFADQVGLALQPGFSEILSEETRKTQRALLILSFVLFLISFGAVKFAGPIEIAGLKFEGVTARGVVLATSTIIATYLELLVAIRCFVEWHAWRLGTRAGELTSLSLREQFARLVAEANADVMKRGFIGLRDDVKPEVIREQPEPLRGALERLAMLRAQGPHYRWFLRTYSAYAAARRARFLLEVCFPLVFAATAIGFSIRAVFATD